jgi:hypothetical protein
MPRRVRVRHNFVYNMNAAGDEIEDWMLGGMGTEENGIKQHSRRPRRRQLHFGF